MTIYSPLSNRLSLPALATAFLACYAAPPPLTAQIAVEEHVIVTGDDVTSAYGAPGGLSRARFAPLTSAYVLPPWTFYFGTIYQGSFFDDGAPDHLFTEEVEMGLPHRFGLAAETTAERFKGGGGFQT